MQNNKILEEGLRKGDLVDCVFPFFEVDSYRSKMGEDDDVVVLTFQAKDRYPAKDFMEFIEKGYPFVLDADVSAGENEDGDYSIFVEIQRSPKVSEYISEMLFGLSRLTGIDDWEFSYYKNKNKTKATTENLKKVIPNSSKMYEAAMQKHRTDETRKFFSKTLLDDLILEGDVITILKPFEVSYKFQIVAEGDSDLLENSEATTFAADENSMAEIFWLTKVMGDYDIQKVGENFLFHNGNKQMILKRV